MGLGESVRLKAETLARADLVGRSTTRGDLRATVASGPFVDALGGVSFTVEVRRVSDGLDVTPTGMNPILVYNAPTLVADPAGSVDLGRRGRHRVDPGGALLEVVRGLL